MSITFRLLVDSWSGFVDLEASNNVSYVTLVRQDSARRSAYPSVMVSKGSAQVGKLKLCCIRSSNFILSVSILECSCFVIKFV